MQVDDTILPHIVSEEPTQISIFYLTDLIFAAETIQGRKLYEEIFALKALINYILFRSLKPISPANSAQSLVENSACILSI